LREDLEKSGHLVEIIGPSSFRTVPLPTYPDIRLALLPGRRLKILIDRFIAEHGNIERLHIATEGPLGWAARRLAVRRGLAFTTAFHTRFPEYLARRAPVPTRLSYAVLRRFHQPSRAVMVATDSLAQDLESRGFKNLHRWSRGIDFDLFRRVDGLFQNLPRPVMLFVGRVAIEKNIRAFLDLDLPGSKVVVGDGPQLKQLQRLYPGVTFTGALYGEQLAEAYSGADVSVFPSLTDTLGLTILESLACGTPVAAYDATGPRDILKSTDVGVIDDDLGTAIRRTLAARIPPERCRAFVVSQFTREIAAGQFMAGAV
jgi:glycosyltransferase involved in cell wall biosynthesis